ERLARARSCALKLFTNLAPEALGPLFLSSAAPSRNISSRTNFSDTCAARLPTRTPTKGDWYGWLRGALCFWTRWMFSRSQRRLSCCVFSRRVSIHHLGP